MDRAKPYDIPKREVWEAYKRVRANQGAAGVDGQMISDFEADLENNLYKLWNRLSSGSYFPPPVRRVDIPKSDGRMRPLGIPTVADRIAQMVVKRHLEPLVEPQFHPDSYGNRPGKSALDAVGMARQRCWRRDWVLDLDIKAFFDSIDTELLMLSMAARNSPESSGRNSPLHSDLVTAESPRRCDIGEAIEVEIDDFLKCLGGGAVAQAFGQCVGPSDILGL